MPNYWIIYSHPEYLYPFYPSVVVVEMVGCSKTESWNHGVFSCWIFPAPVHVFFKKAIMGAVGKPVWVFLGSDLSFLLAYLSNFFWLVLPMILKYILAYFHGEHYCCIWTQGEERNLKRRWRITWILQNALYCWYHEGCCQENYLLSND